MKKCPTALLVLVLRRCAATSVAAFALLDAAPLNAVAHCAVAKPFDYGDVESIYLRRGGLGEPKYTFTVNRNGMIFLSAVRGTPVLGVYGGDDGMQLYAKVLGSLKKDDFLTMYLSPAKAAYLDGPMERNCRAGGYCVLTTTIWRRFAGCLCKALRRSRQRNPSGDLRVALGE